ncbi:MAG TPA: hypothetical protein VFU22_18875, partial [Roseiflexaceae bacterium]|nr:hypothetical protein [Roseiflexaceae bacterium]
DVHESYPLGELPAPSADDAPAPEGAQQYLQLGQPPEVQTAFDELTGASMQESMAEARGQIDQAAQDRDQQHQEAVDQAQRNTEAAQQQAHSDQSNAVGDSRREIEAQRQSTLAQQQAAVADVEQQASDRSQTDRQQVDDRVRDDQAQLDDRYSQAEADAEAEVQRGEREAEAERQRAERESDEQSWWEAALDFITDLFDALVSLINDIFDAVRAAVNAVLDAVRDFALALIDLAADFVKGLISAFGEFLKGLVQGLLGELFPELAQALTELIDSAVELANSAIDAVAETLKTAVNAIVEGLRAGLNRLIDIYQSAVNTALALARAALTGDWGAFIIQLIEAACRVAGLDPEQVFAFIGRAQETIQLIVDNPGRFLSNAVAALTGGIQRFADHFLEHLQAGIIAWLTGAIGGAGITLPERFDLMGVISLVAQILGLTWENLRLRLVRLIGERGVQVLEFVAGYIQTLIEGGWSALWERIQNDLGMLRDMVLEQIRNYLVERVIMAAITRLATLFNPIGALVNILIAAYNFYTFIRDQLQRIMQVVTVIVDAIGNIARGVLEPAQASVETFLAGLLPLALDLLARLLGLGDVGARVREILQSVQNLVWGAIDRLINWVVGLFRGGAGAAASEPAAQGAEGAAEGQIGERIPITIPGQETHHLFISVSGGNAQVMVQSELRTARQLYDVFHRNLASATNRETAERLLGEFDRLERSTDQVADQQVHAHAPATPSGANQPAGASANSGVVQAEQGLAQVIGQLFLLFPAELQQRLSPERAVITRFQAEIDRADQPAQADIVDNLSRLSRTPAGQNFEQQEWAQVRPALETQEFYVRPLLQTSRLGSTAHQELVTNFNAANSRVAQNQRFTDEQLRGLDKGVFVSDNLTPKVNAANATGLYQSARDGLRQRAFDQGARAQAQGALTNALVDSIENRETSALLRSLEDAARHPVIQPRFQAAGADRQNNPWVAVFLVGGRRITAAITAGRYQQGQQITLGDAFRLSNIANAEQIVATTLLQTIQQAAEHQAPGSANDAEFLRTAQVQTSAAARSIMQQINGLALYFVTPTDIPRNVPQGVPYVRVRANVPGGGRPIVSHSLYEAIANRFAGELRHPEREIHHVLPLYLGGAHIRFNLAEVYGAAADENSTHHVLHQLIDRVDISSILGQDAGSVTLEDSDLRRVYGANLNVLIGTLYADGDISYEDTEVRLSGA